MTGLLCVIVRFRGTTPGNRTKNVLVTPPSFVDDVVPGSIEGNTVGVLDFPEKVKSLGLLLNAFPKRLIGPEVFGIKTPYVRCSKRWSENIWESEHVGLVDWLENLARVGSLPIHVTMKHVGWDSTKTDCLESETILNKGFFSSDSYSGTLGIYDSLSVEQCGTGNFFGGYSLAIDDCNAEPAAYDADDRERQIKPVKAVVASIVGIVLFVAAMYFGYYSKPLEHIWFGLLCFVLSGICLVIVDQTMRR